MTAFDKINTDGWMDFHTSYTLFQSYNKTAEVVPASEEQLKSHSNTSHELITESLFTAHTICKGGFTTGVTDTNRSQKAASKEKSNQQQYKEWQSVTAGS